MRTFDCNGDLIATLQPDAGYDLRLASRGACAYSDAARVALLCMQTAKNGVRDKWGRASSSILDGLEAAAAAAEAAAAGEEPLVSPTSTPASTTRLARYSCPLTLLSVYPAMAEQLGAEPSNSELRQVLARFTHAQRLDEARLAANPHPHLNPNPIPNPNSDPNPSPSPNPTITTGELRRGSDPPPGRHPAQPQGEFEPCGGAQQQHGEAEAQRIGARPTPP